MSGFVHEKDGGDRVCICRDRSTQIEWHDSQHSPVISARKCCGADRMTSTGFHTKRLADNADAVAPDGSEVRLLCTTARGSMAGFRLMQGAVAKAVVHRSVEEIWYVTGGNGRIWRKFADREEVTILEPGVSLTITTGTQF